MKWLLDSSEVIMRASATARAADASPNIAAISAAAMFAPDEEMPGFVTQDAQ
jgi:hypothetical protein